MNSGFSKRFCIVSLYKNSLPKLRLKLQYILISYIFQRILYKMEKMNRVSAFKTIKNFTRHYRKTEVSSENSEPTKSK